jgi:oxygen-independent coproporphyrinogen III oxidase
VTKFTQNKSLAGAYIHIPFCKQACTYCDFHFSTNLGNKKTLVDAISREISLRKDYLTDSSLQSIYFGGGTPSLLSRSELETILLGLNQNYNWNTDSEICFETNPDDITVAALKNWIQVGINRLSIGLQSFNNQELKWMNRAHTAEESTASVKLAQDTGITNITIDLIYGSKYQTLESWELTLRKAISLNTQHISAYNLTIEEKTALGINHKKGKEPGINDELSSRQFLMMKELLEEVGFIHYEVSNFAKPGYFAKHNSNYWLQQPYIGFGPSAHSFNSQSRQWNVKSNSGYIQSVNDGKGFYEIEELSLNDKFNEYILTRLRTIWGCNINEMTKLFGSDLTESFIKRIKSKNDLVTENQGIYTLTKSGLLFADGLASDLFIV